MTPLAAALVLVSTGAAAGKRAATFTDVTSDAKVDYLQWDTNIWQGALSQDVRIMTGGAAAAEYDGDGLTDLFVTRLGQPDLLYRNKGDGTFEDVSTAAGFTESLPTNGPAWGDIDNDGDPDLYVTGVGTSQHYLYVNDGLGTFTEQAVARGADVPSGDERHGFSATFGDYDRDGYLDVHTNHWGHGSSGAQLARLLHNRGVGSKGYFDDVTVAAGVSLAGVPAESPSGTLRGVFSFASRLTDLDGDGWADLVIAGDFKTSRIFWNNRDGTFDDARLRPKSVPTKTAWGRRWATTMVTATWIGLSPRFTIPATPVTAAFVPGV